MASLPEITIHPYGVTRGTGLANVFSTNNTPLRGDSIVGSRELVGGSQYTSIAFFQNPCLSVPSVALYISCTLVHIRGSSIAAGNISVVSIKDTSHAKLL